MGIFYAPPSVPVDIVILYYFCVHGGISSILPA